MSTIKEWSASVTDSYVSMLCSKAILDSLGGDAKPADINRMTLIRVRVREQDAEIRERLQCLRQFPLANIADPDSDCRC